MRRAVRAPSVINIANWKLGFPEELPSKITLSVCASSPA
jgi:hypothetical protein